MYVDVAPNDWQSMFTSMHNIGVTHIILGFYTGDATQEAEDAFGAWTTFYTNHQDTATAARKFLDEKNMKLMVSMGGAVGSNNPSIPSEYLQVVEKKKYGGRGCIYDNIYTNAPNYFSTDYGLDGFDIDFEQVARDLDGLEDKYHLCYQRLKNFITSVKKKWHNGKKPIVSSAPQSPYFNNQDERRWLLNYIYIEQQDPTLFDFYNLQFYNNGEPNDETMYDTNAKPANPVYTNVAYMLSQFNTEEEEAQQATFKKKIVLGKCSQGCLPLTASYAGGAYLKRMAKKFGLGGIMYWEWSSNDKDRPVLVPPEEWIKDEKTGADRDWGTCYGGCNHGGLCYHRSSLCHDSQDPPDKTFPCLPNQEYQEKQKKSPRTKMCYPYTGIKGDDCGSYQEGTDIGTQTIFSYYRGQTCEKVVKITDISSANQFLQMDPNHCYVVTKNGKKECDRNPFPAPPTPSPQDICSTVKQNWEKAGDEFPGGYCQGCDAKCDSECGTGDNQWGCCVSEANCEGCSEKWIKCPHS